MDDLFFTVEEAARRLNVNPETIRRRIRQGKMKAQLLPGPRGDQYQIPASELTTQDAEIVPVPQLPSAIVEQIAQAVATINKNAVNETVTAAVEPLYQKIDQLEALLQEQSRQTSEFIEETRAERKAREKRGFWARVIPWPRRAK